MFDDFRLKKFKSAMTPTPVHIFQKLPHLRSNSREENPKISQGNMNFSEFSVLNHLQLPINRPPNVNLNMNHAQKANISIQPTSKTRSVSFINFTEALTTVAKISNIEEKCNKMLKQLITGNRKTYHNKVEKKQKAPDAPVVRKRIVSIFNYPILKMAEIQNPEMNSGQINNKKNNKKPEILEITNENAITERNENIMEKNKEKRKVIRKKIIERAKSSNQRIVSVNDIKPLIFGEKLSLKLNNENEQEAQPLFIKVKQKLFSNLNNANAAKNEVKQKITNKNETLEIHEDKMQIEPWQVQDTQPEENI